MSQTQTDIARRSAIARMNAEAARELVADAAIEAGHPRPGDDWGARETHAYTRRALRALMYAGRLSGEQAGQVERHLARDEGPAMAGQGPEGRQYRSALGCLLAAYPDLA